MLDYAFREIGKRKKRYLLNVAVVALIVTLVITLNSLSIGFKDASKLPFQDIHSSIIIQRNGNVPANTSGAVCSCSLAPIRHGYVTDITKIDGVEGVSYGLLLWVFDSDHFKRVLGANYSDSFGKNIAAKVVDGSLPVDDAGALVDAAYAQQYHLIPGDKIGVCDRNYTITGIVRSAGKDMVSSDVYLNLPLAQDLAYNSRNLQEAERFDRDDVNLIFVDTQQAAFESVSKSVNELLNKSTLMGGKTPTGQVAGKFTVYTPRSFENQISSLMAMSDKLINAVLIVSLIGAILLIIKSMSYVVIQRKKEFGIMKAVGYTSRDIQKEIVAETSIQLLAGFIAGVMVSIIAVMALSRLTISMTIPWELNPYPHFLMENPDTASLVQTYLLPVQFQVHYAIFSLLLVLITGIITVIVLTRIINRLKVTEMLANE